MSFDMIKLGEISDITKLAGFEFTKHIKYIEDGEIIALRALNLRKGELDLTEIKRIDRAVSESLTRSKLYENDILLTYTGNGYGDCAMITENDKYHLAPNICKITPKTEKMDPYYLYAYIRSDLFYQTMSMNMTGSSQPTIPMKTIRVLEVPVPEKSIQEKIGSISKAIDEKIRINKQINRNLYEQAQALFVNRFVDIPPEGEQKPLYDFAEYINGTSFKKDEYKMEGIPIIKITELKNGITSSTQYFAGEKDKKYDVRNGDILFSWSGNPDTSIDIFIWTHGQGILNQHTFNVKTNDDYKWFVFLMLKYFKSEFSAIASNKQTTGLGHVTVADLKRLTFVYAREEIESFENEVAPIMNLIYKNMLENGKLESLRDSLLPKLMSGKLDVSDLKI